MKFDLTAIRSLQRRINETNRAGALPTGGGDANKHDQQMRWRINDARI